MSGKIKEKEEKENGGGENGKGEERERRRHQHSIDPQNNHRVCSVIQHARDIDVLVLPVGQADPVLASAPFPALALSPPKEKIKWTGKGTGARNMGRKGKASTHT